MTATNRALGGPEWRGRLHHILFETNDRASTAFDVALILAILASVAVVLLDSVETVVERHGVLLHSLEWAFTVLFTIEYALRLAVVESKRRYAFSFFGIVDLLSIVPTYLSLLMPDSRFLAIIRVVRVLRVFHVLKLMRYLGEAQVLGRAIATSRYRIAVFLFAVMTMVVILGSFMYLIEGADAGFTSIPVSVYWAVVTLTTVGFGDITPATTLGRFVASLIMLLGYGMIAVPTGIVSVGMAQAAQDARNVGPAAPRATGFRSGTKRRVCSECDSEERDPDARFCKRCAGAIVERDSGDE